MTYPCTQANGTRNLLARMTRDQAALQTRSRPSTALIASPSAPKSKAQAADDNEMICRGNCYNDSMVEMFFKTIKSELI